MTVKDPGFHIIVPARYQASRLPGKPLLDIGGKPMIQHVVERCKESAARSVVVATDSRRITDAVESFGGEAVLTAPDHPSGSDRIAEASSLLGIEDGEIIVNVQGDEPDMSARLINQLVEGLVNDEVAAMATASAPLDHEAQLADPAVVKVVCDQSGHAMYFSRAPIPWVRDSGSSCPAENAGSHVSRHLGIYAYRAGFLRKYARMKRPVLEELEKLEQLRVLWHGHKILCLEAVVIPDPGIDTPEDLTAARKKYGSL